MMHRGNSFNENAPMHSLITYIPNKVNKFKTHILGSGDLMDKVSASQTRDRGFDHDSSYDTSIGWFQEADSRVI